VPSIDVEYMTRLTAELCAIPSPTGLAAEAVAYVARELDALDVPYRYTRKGALVATLQGGAAPVRTLAAHVDTLGAMVKEIKANGRLLMTQVGSFPWAAIEGETCVVHTSDGTRVTGTIVNVKASHHVHGTEQDKAERSEKTLEVRLDERVAGPAEVRALGIEVGDFISLDPRVVVTPSGFIKSRHLDDKACVAIVLGVARAVHEGDVPLAATTHLFISNYEETGHGACAGIPPETEELIAVDMAAVGEGQTSDEYSATICVKDASGPYDHALSKALRRAGDRAEVPYKVDIYTHYSSDASAALTAGAEVRAALVGPGIDASHAHERTHVDALRATAQLLLEYLTHPSS
jgi:putative aminopeptidase FrvX